MEHVISELSNTEKASFGSAVHEQGDIIVQHSLTLMKFTDVVTRTKINKQIKGNTIIQDKVESHSWTQPLNLF